MNKTNGELSKWTIAFLGTAGGAAYRLRPDVSLGLSFRTPIPEVTDHYAIKRLQPPADEIIMLNSAALLNRAMELTVAAWEKNDLLKRASVKPDLPSGHFIRKLADPAAGLLVMYLLDPAAAGLKFSGPPAAAFALNFPGSSSEVKVEYKVNNVYWEQESGPA